MTIFKTLIAVSTALALTAGTAVACQNTGSFDRWLRSFKAEAAAQGISKRIINAALDGPAAAKDLLGFDRLQLR